MKLTSLQQTKKIQMIDYLLNTGEYTIHSNNYTIFYTRHGMFHFQTYSYFDVMIRSNVNFPMLTFIRCSFNIWQILNTSLQFHFTPQADDNHAAATEFK